MARRWFIFARADLLTLRPSCGPQETSFFWKCVKTVKAGFMMLVIALKGREEHISV
jgi:hypothetical protein